MTQLQYAIPTTTRFSYNEGAEGEHQLFISFDWTSPVTNKTINSMVLLNQNINRDKIEFYNIGVSMMKNEYQLQGIVANKMAEVLREELEASGGINWEQVAKEKFDEAMKLTYDFVLYVDLEQSSQSGQMPS